MGTKKEKLTPEQKEFKEVHEEDQKLHDQVDDAIPAGVDAVNPPYPISENIEEEKKNGQINEVRSSTYDLDIEETKSPFIASQDFTDIFNKFHEEHGVYATVLHASTATLDRLHLRQPAVDAQLTIKEGGREDGTIELTFGE